MKRFLHFFKFLTIAIGVGTITGVVVMLIALRDKGEISVPTIEGNDIVTALEKISDVGLNLKLDDLAFDEDVPRNVIISQDPMPGAGLKRGRDVRVVVSRGAKDLLMPDVKNISVRQAQNMLHQQGIPLPSIIGIHSEAEQDSVIAQLPPAGERISEGSRVDLLISMGAAQKETILPDFTGLKLENVMEKVRSAGMKIGRVRYVDSERGESGTVLEQDPAAGKPVVPEQEISFVVKKEATISGTPRTYTVYTYAFPSEPTEGTVKVVSENVDGEKEIYNRRHKAGEKISLLVEVAGQTSIRIYINDELAEVRRF